VKLASKKRRIRSLPEKKIFLEKAGGVEAFE
jgi:hypothetical protein